MGDFLTYKHSFNAGDLITALPGIQKLYKEKGKKAIIYQRLDMPAYYFDDANHPVKTDGRQVCMNETVFNMMKPLLESQEYIESFEIWQGEKVVYDFDLTRHNSQIPIPAGDIHAWVTLTFPTLQCDLSEPWLSVKTIPNNLILINRTRRYNNPYIDYFFLKNHSDKIAFIGLPDEYSVFCQQFNLVVPYIQVKDFYELAQVIAGCRFIVCNQSLAYHLADAMKTPRILEVCNAFPNCFPTGADGHAFITQNWLEFLFEKLLKETE